MRLRNGEHGYGLVTKWLHWAVFVAIVAQLVVGYSLHRADDLSDWAVDRWLSGEEDRLLLVHAGLGIGILGLAVVRVVWRRATPLPPWAPGLTGRERRVVTWTERSLYALLFLIPATGLALLFAAGTELDLADEREWTAPIDLVDGDLALVLHIATHLAFFVALLVHVGLVVKHQLVDRDRLMNRML